MIITTCNKPSKVSYHLLPQNYSTAKYSPKRVHSNMEVRWEKWNEIRNDYDEICY